MKRISDIASDFYRKYAPLAEKANVRLDIDLGHCDIEDIKSSGLESEIEKALGSAIKRSAKGNVTLSVTKDHVIVKDTGRVLSKAVCELLSNDKVKVTSRVGFGTTAKIKLK